MNATRMSTAGVSAALALVLALPFVAVRADDDRDEGEARRTPPPAVYIDECGGCHAPYPASGLPPASWRTLMSTLDRHFGGDATLAPAEATVVRDWLLANAGRRAANPAAPLRVTRTAWFVSEHDEVPASIWRSQAVGSAANCGGCHRGADRGTFSERDVRMPRVSTPRSSAGAKP
jgi:mono/diheme cytochrome c family protein